MMTTDLHLSDVTIIPVNVVNLRMNPHTVCLSIGDMATGRVNIFSNPEQLKDVLSRASQKIEEIAPTQKPPFDPDDLLKMDPVFELLFALGISADEWESGVLDEYDGKQARDSDADRSNQNDLGLTAPQRQQILDTLKGKKKWGAIE